MIVHFGVRGGGGVANAHRGLRRGHLEILHQGHAHLEDVENEQSVNDEVAHNAVF
jgi:hypothetical protein